MRAIKRREFLAGAALVSGGLLVTNGIAFADSGTAKRFVFVILRGALDGLAAVPPYGDADYARLRGAVALGAPGAPNGALRLDGLFGLHPSLVFLHESLRPTSSSSFTPSQVPTGSVRTSMARTCLRTAALERTRCRRAGSIGLLRPCRPMRARGAASSALRSDRICRSSCAGLRPSPPGHRRIWRRLMRTPCNASRICYSARSAVGATPRRRTGDAVGARRRCERTGAAQPSTAPAQLLAPAAAGTVRRGAPYREIIHATAAFLTSDDGPRVAVFDATGWDTHANEGGAQGQLATRLAGLDAGLRTLKEEMKAVWRDTAVLVVTEFGRTAAVNGTRGTDHGTGPRRSCWAARLHGGRVIATGPALARAPCIRGAICCRHWICIGIERRTRRTPAVPTRALASLSFRTAPRRSRCRD